MNSMMRNKTKDKFIEMTKRTDIDLNGVTTKNDIQRIIGYDPRIKVDNVLVDQLDMGLQVQIELTVLPDNYSDVINLQFNRDLNTVVAA